MQINSEAELSGEVFITGATGFIGSSLLKKWIDASDARISLLVRGKSGQSPDERIRSVLADLYEDADVPDLSARIAIVEGDVAMDMLALSASEYQKLAQMTSYIIHCAAAARFDLEIDEARRTNVSGTQNILAFALRCKALERIDYVSTAYVAGTRTGIIKEDELDCGQRFNNTYEQTKLEAEKIIRESMHHLPIAIQRPSIVICDSKTGRVSGHDAFSRMMRRYFLGQLRMLPGYASTLLDLVPADYVADAMYSIWRDRSSLGGCYHLTAGLNNLISLEDVRDLVSHYFHREPFTLITPEEFDAYVSRVGDKLSEEQRDLIEEISLYMPYLTGNLRFDNANTSKETGLEAPGVSSYFPKMVEYIGNHTLE